AVDGLPHRAILERVAPSLDVVRLIFLVVPVLFRDEGEHPVRVPTALIRQNCRNRRGDREVEDSATLQPNDNYIVIRVVVAVLHIVPPEPGRIALSDPTL